MIGIQAVNGEGVELEHVYSIVVKVGDGNAYNNSTCGYVRCHGIWK